MKFKKIMLVTLVLLAILTIGAASASEDVVSDDDGLAVVDEDASVDAPAEEVETDDVLSSDYDDFDFDDYVEEEDVYLEDDGEVLSITPPDVGNLSVSVNDGVETSEHLYEITEDDVDDEYFGLTLSDLEITEPGVYLISAKFISPSGDETTIFENKELNVISEEDIDDEYEIFLDEGRYSLSDDDEYIAEITVPEDADGYVVISIDGYDDHEIPLSNLDEDEGSYYIYPSTLLWVSPGTYQVEVLYCEYSEIFATASGEFTFYNDEDDDEDDADDGVVIWIPDGDDQEFDLNDPDDLNTPFAFVSVNNDLSGRIVIMLWDYDDYEWNEFFGRDLENITNKEDDSDNEGFTIYKLSLNDLGNYEDLIDYGEFKLAFVDDDEIDSRSYNIDFEEGVVTFWESDDDEVGGEGEYLDYVIFVAGNVITNDIIIYIPNNVSDIVDDEFEVWDTDRYDFKLSELVTVDGFYIIKLRDLFEIDEVGEVRGLNIFIQFYDDGEKAYYAAPDEYDYSMEVYTSPFVNDEAYILENGFVVSFRGFEDVDDEFTVTISQEGAADIVKTFKISEFQPLDDDYLFYELHLSDLDITEPGNYTIAVKFTLDGEELAYNVGNIDVGTVLVRAHGPDEDEDPVVSDVSTRVFHIGVSEDIAGFARLFVDGVQVGGNISFADLEFDTWPSHYGRQIYLNDYHITENGTYTFKVEVYDENGRFLADCENELQIAVGENSFEFVSGPYGSEGGFEVVICTPFEDGQYYNIYFNGELAGTYTLRNRLVISDKYFDRYFDVNIFKPGVYDVNVTFFDGENETDVTTGSFSINELILTSDKPVYIFEEDHIMISFNVSSLGDDDCLKAYYVYYWDNVQREDDMIFNPYGGKDMKDDGLYENGVVSFDVAWTPDGHYAMEEGTTLIYVEFKHGEEVFGGFIEVNVEESEEYIFMTTGNVNPHFDVNTPSNVTGKVIIKNGDNIIKEENLDEIAEYDDEDDRWHHDVNVDSSDLDEGEYTITVVYEDGDGNVIQSKDFEIEIGNPVPLGDPARIFIMWSDWPASEKVEYDLDSTDMIHIYPGDDDSESSDITIVVKIDDEVYLEATLAELNLEAQFNDHYELYYTIGPAHFTEDIAPGHYDNVIAYYYSSKYITTSDENGMPIYANLFGDSSVTFDDIEYTYGDEGTTTMVIDGATVSLENITVDNHPEAQIALQDNVITVSGLAAGNYILKVVTTPINEYYRSVEASANITVKSRPIIPVDPELAIAPVGDVEEGTNVVISISARDNFTGSVKVLVGDAVVGTADVVAGSGTYGIVADKLAVGENTVKVVSEANENFTAGSANVTFNVIEKVVPPTPVPVDPELAIEPVGDVEEGTNVVITISALDNFTGSVKVLVGDAVVGTADVVAGSGTYGIAADKLAVGENTVKVVSEASENFTAGEANVTFTVTEKVVPPVGPIDPNLTISVDDIREGTDAVITITTNSTFSGNVKVQIGTDNYTVPVTNGTGSIPVSGLAVGNYTAVATFEATDVFIASTKNATFKVNKAVVPDPETAISTDSTSSNPNPVYSINLGPDATGNFTVKVGDKEYTKELKGGAATIEVTDLPAGTYEAVISYSGDAKYAPISKTVNATVKVVTVIKATDVTTTYGTSKNIVITLIDANGKALAGKKVTVVLNGAKKELTTDAKGQASYAVGANLAVKTYEVSFTFDGDANYTSATGTAKVVVNKAKSKLTAKKKTFKAKKKSKKYTVTLKTDKGKALKKVKVTLTGKFKGKKIKITKKTNSKGKATFNLKKLTKKGKFKATVKFAGNKNYKASSKKVKITIK